MADYKPKENHPWRRYKNSPAKEATDEELVEDKKLPSLKEFLSSVVENWDTYAIPANDFDVGLVKIKNMAQPKAAAWLTSMIEKTWIKRDNQLYA